MNEKDKRNLGILYNPNHDSTLQDEMVLCKGKCQKFNMSCDMEILKELFGKCGEDVTVLPSFWCDYGYNIEMGNHVFINHNAVILDGAKVILEDNCFIGPNCGLYTAAHPFEVNLRNEGLEYAKPIHIKKNVWLGGNVVVCPGVTIGNNVIIGAGSVVTHDIPDDVIAAGNPCKVIRKNKEVKV